MHIRVSKHTMIVCLDTRTSMSWYLLSIHTCDGMLLCDRPNLLYSIAIAQYMYRTKPYYTCTLFCLTFLCWGYITVFLYNYKYFLSAFLRVISLTLTQVWIYEFSPETITRSVWFKYNDAVTYTNVSNIIKRNLMGHALIYSTSACVQISGFFLSGPWNITSQMQYNITVA